MICAFCKKKIKSRDAELLYLLPRGEEVGLHPKCEEKYQNEREK